MDSMHSSAFMVVFIDSNEQQGNAKQHLIFYGKWSAKCKSAK